MSNSQTEWQMGVDAPRDGTFFIAWNGESMAIINWVPGHPPGIWRYSNLFNKWFGYPRTDFVDFDFWQPLPEAPHGYREGNFVAPGIFTT
jgi:hypothetical protein